MDARRSAAISPELVLVDPELARTARADLPAPPPEPAVRPVPTAVTRPAAPAPAAVAGPATATADRRRLRPAVARTLAVAGLVLLGAIGGFTAKRLADRDAGQRVAASGSDALSAPVATGATTAPRPSVAPPPTAAEPRPLVSAPASTTAVRPPPPRPGAKRPARGTPPATTATPPAPARTTTPVATTPAAQTNRSVRVPSKTSVEVAVLSLLNRKPAVIPAHLRDGSTGLLRNNVLVVCTRAGTTNRFDCRVTVAGSGGAAWGGTYFAGARGGEVRWDPPRTRRR